MLGQQRRDESADSRVASPRTGFSRSASAADFSRWVTSTPNFYSSDQRATAGFSRASPRTRQAPLKLAECNQRAPSAATDLAFPGRLPFA